MAVRGGGPGGDFKTVKATACFIRTLLGKSMLQERENGWGSRWVRKRMGWRVQGGLSGTGLDHLK